ncbi:hypothetical protein BDK63_002308 [Halomonas campaniensis]|uniref:Uncharacterized protein n=1 Tax=Halomonas campaniensis TaxID=213554 RepID=A0A7W5K3S2_9GAMM|nr:hypothetical protein [Halomonas campaniensis]
MMEMPIATRESGASASSGLPPPQMMTPCPALPGGAFFMAGNR